jgi:hypothetical protein
MCGIRGKYVISSYQNIFYESFSLLYIYILYFYNLFHILRLFLANSVSKEYNVCKYACDIAMKSVVRDTSLQNSTR